MRPFISSSSTDESEDVEEKESELDEDDTEYLR